MLLWLISKVVKVLQVGIIAVTGQFELSSASSGSHWSNSEASGTRISYLREGHQYLAYIFRESQWFWKLSQQSPVSKHQKCPCEGTQPNTSFTETSDSVMLGNSWSSMVLKTEPAIGSTENSMDSKWIFLHYACWFCTCFKHSPVVGTCPYLHWCCWKSNTQGGQSMFWWSQPFDKLSPTMTDLFKKKKSHYKVINVRSDKWVTKEAAKSFNSRFYSNLQSSYSTPLKSPEIIRSETLTLGKAKARN